MLKRATAEELKPALEEAASRDNNKPLLVAHYRATDRTATTKELASAVGFADATGVNAQYGNLASRVCENLGRNEFEPKVRILVSFVDNKYVMHSEVAEALEQLGWV